MSTNGGMQLPWHFQEKMNKLLQGFEYTHAYIDDLLVSTIGNWTNNLTNLWQILIKIQENGLKCNVDNSFFGQPEMEYLGFWVTSKGVNPTEKQF